MDFASGLDKLKPAERTAALRKHWALLLGNIEPSASPKLVVDKAEEFAGGKLRRVAL
jgi:hypothetical protein